MDLVHQKLFKVNINSEYFYYSNHFRLLIPDLINCNPCMTEEPELHFYWVVPSTQVYRYNFHTSLAWCNQGLNPQPPSPHAIQCGLPVSYQGSSIAKNIQSIHYFVQTGKQKWTVRQHASNHLISGHKNATSKYMEHKKD